MSFGLIPAKIQQRNSFHWLYLQLRRIWVKNFIRTGNVEGKVKKDFYGNVEVPLKAVNRKPILPTEEEIASNTRARSAKLRIAEKSVAKERRADDED